MNIDVQADSGTMTPNVVAVEKFYLTPAPAGEISAISVRLSKNDETIEIALIALASSVSSCWLLFHI